MRALNRVVLLTVFGSLATLIGCIEAPVGPVNEVAPDVWIGVADNQGTPLPRAMPSSGTSTVQLLADTLVIRGAQCRVCGDTTFSRVVIRRITASSGQATDERTVYAGYHSGDPSTSWDFNVTVTTGPIPPLNDQGWGFISGSSKLSLHWSIGGFEPKSMTNNGPEYFYRFKSP
jgi:hypothetical protein